MQENIRFEKIEGKSIIDSLMDAKGKRFGFIVLNTGFVRSKENFRAQRRKNEWKSLGGSLAGALFGVGVYYPTIYSASNVYAMIIDAKENKTVFYNEDNGAYPLKEQSLRSRLKAILRFFSGVIKTWTAGDKLAWVQ